MCTGAVLEPIDPDTATGKEGDVEARCFGQPLCLFRSNTTNYLPFYRTRLSAGPAGSNGLPRVGLWPLGGRRSQRAHGPDQLAH